jgi:hypothetical protein
MTAEPVAVGQLAPETCGFLLLSATRSYRVEFGVENEAELDTIFGYPITSCCYQGSRIIVRDSSPKSGAYPARSPGGGRAAARILLLSTAA